MEQNQNQLISFIKPLFPKTLLKLIRKYREESKFKEYTKLSTEQIFSKIYEEGVWGKSDDSEQKFCSGPGSHDDFIISSYIEAIHGFLSEFETKPNVVDLGCGDFNVGSQVRKQCGNYIACDIVPKLIAFNKNKFKELNVDFRVLDLTIDELPNGEIVFIRQVLQHLSNNQIKMVLPKITEKFKYLVLSEHLSNELDFEPNLDKPAGPGIRTALHSGIVISEPPFNFRAISAKEICNVRTGGGPIVTTVYQLK
jgi:2-polyprenyl-3-methyl-5-hydroxy-6-metoxy-1,4-benzoquinol methylase